MNSFAKLTASALVLAGTLICAGWQFRIGFLKGGAFGTFTSPNAALLFVLVGLSCLLQMRAKSALSLNVGRLVAAMVVVFAGALILEYVLHLDMGIDMKFF